MGVRLPLPTLLSHALVAFTIEFDNEFERQTPHRTTNHGPTAGSRHAPWLVSMVMWTKFMQFVPDDGIPVRDLQRLTGLSDKSLLTWLTRPGKWWGYVVVGPDPADSRPKPPRSEWLVPPYARRAEGSRGVAAAVRHHRDPLGAALWQGRNERSPAAPGSAG